MQSKISLRSLGGAQGVERHVWRRVRAGFAVVIPALATYLALRFLAGYADGMMSPLTSALPFTFPGLGLLLAVAALYLIGLAASARLGKAVEDVQRAVFSRIPVARSIYQVTKQAADNLSTAGAKNFRRVVFVEWPRRDVFALAFVTGQCDLDGEANRVSVYIPTVPNPTSGMFALVRESEVIETDISVEEALKLVLSGGIILPDAMGGMRLSRGDANAGIARGKAGGRWARRCADKSRRAGRPRRAAGRQMPLMDRAARAEWEERASAAASRDAQAA